MENLFKQICQFASDIYIADYTEYSKTHDVSPLPGGVYVTNTLPPHILSLHIENPRSLQVKVANFEENMDVFTLPDGSRVQQCECALWPETNQPSKWVMLTEMKYPKEKNAKSNIIQCYSKLTSTYQYLHDVKGVLHDEDQHYLVICLPAFPNRVPFESFILTPYKLTELRKKRIHVVGDTDFSIIDETHIKCLRKYHKV